MIFYQRIGSGIDVVTGLLSDCGNEDSSIKKLAKESGELKLDIHAAETSAKATSSIGLGFMILAAVTHYSGVDTRVPISLMAGAIAVAITAPICFLVAGAEFKRRDQKMQNEVKKFRANTKMVVKNYLADKRSERNQRNMSYSKAGQTLWKLDL